MDYTLEEFLTLVRNMRAVQQRFFLRRNMRDLEEAKRLETLVDAAAKKMSADLEAKQFGVQAPLMLEDVAAQLTKAERLLLETICQACEQSDGTLDSQALTAYAEALRYLGERGYVKITDQYARRVLARPLEVAPTSP